MTKFQRRVDEIETEASRNQHNAYIVDEITKLINPTPPPKIRCRVVDDPRPGVALIEPIHFDERNRCIACGETPVAWLREGSLFGHKLYCERHAAELKREERLPDHISLGRWHKLIPGHKNG